MHELMCIIDATDMQCQQRFNFNTSSHAEFLISEIGDFSLELVDGSRTCSLAQNLSSTSLNGPLYVSIKPTISVLQPYVLWGMCDLAQCV